MFCRSRILPLLLILTVSACSPDPDATNRWHGDGLQTHALVIGIDTYSGSAGGWPDLDSARTDAEAVGRVLQAEYGFSVTQLVGRDATRKTMLAAMDELTVMGPDDAVLIFYAGHGYYDEEKREGYWIPSDAGSRDDSSGWISNSEVAESLRASGARHVLLIVDSCFGGALLDGRMWDPPAKSSAWYREAGEARSRFVISSGDISPVPDSGGTHSLFARSLVDYLSNPPQRVFSSSDLGLALRRKMQRRTGQVVRMGPLSEDASSEGEFVFPVRDDSL